jgi:hypothetical protein
VLLQCTGAHEFDFVEAVFANQSVRNSLNHAVFFVRHFSPFSEKNRYHSPRQAQDIYTQQEGCSQNVGGFGFPAGDSRR